MSLFIRPQLSSLVLGLLGLGLAIFGHVPFAVAMTSLGLGALLVVFALWNPELRNQLEAEADQKAWDDLAATLQKSADDARALLKPVEAKGTQVLAEAKAKAAEVQGLLGGNLRVAQADVQKVETAVEVAGADVKKAEAAVQATVKTEVDKALNGVDKVAADIADELKKA